MILITGGNRPGMFLELLKNGKNHGVSRLYYTYQEGSGGIADALKLAENCNPSLFPISVVHVSINTVDEVVYKTTMLPALKF